MLSPSVRTERHRFRAYSYPATEPPGLYFSISFATQQGITGTGIVELPKALCEGDQGGQSLPSLTHDASWALASCPRGTTFST